MKSKIVYDIIREEGKVPKLIIWRREDGTNRIYEDIEFYYYETADVSIKPSQKYFIKVRDSYDKSVSSFTKIKPNQYNLEIGDKELYFECELDMDKDELLKIDKGLDNIITRINDAARLSYLAYTSKKPDERILEKLNKPERNKVIEKLIDDDAGIYFNSTDGYKKILEILYVAYLIEEDKDNLQRLEKTLDKNLLDDVIGYGRVLRVKDFTICKPAEMYLLERPVYMVDYLL